MLSQDWLVRLLLFLGLFAAMFFIEGLFPARSWFDLRKQRFWFSIKLAITNQIFMRLVVSAPFVWWSSFVASKGWGLSPLIDLPTWAHVMATVVVFDFFDAIKHMLFHRFHFMWRFHRAHHTDTHLDIFTAFRYHPGEFLISAAFKGLWIVIWGPTAFAFFVFEVVLNMASQFHHSNIAFPDHVEKIVNRVFVTNRYHALHHTINREIGDQNFTTIFTVWDRILGSRTDPVTNPVDLERLGSLQDDHLSVLTLVKSPLQADINCRSQNDLFASRINTIKQKLADGKAVLIDVREQSELDKHGKLASALHFPWSRIQILPEEFTSFTKRLQPREIYIFCAAGVRATKALQILKERDVEAHSLGGLSDICNELDYIPPAGPLELAHA